MERSSRKERTGIVVSDKNSKTRIVKVLRSFRHSVYDKVVRKSSKYYVHDEENASHIGDEVKISETRPISKLKRWRLLQVVKKA